MIFDPENNDKFDEKHDWFDGPDIPETPEEPRKPVCSPDDPEYWEGEESEWEHLRPRNKARPWLWTFLALAVAALMLAGWLCWFSPFVSEASQFGYVESLEKRGDIFKTYEGVLIPYKEFNDTTRTYDRDFVFSVERIEDWKELRRARRDARPVRVDYQVFHRPLPWRGESRVVVTAVDSVDPSKILPPEFNP